VLVRSVPAFPPATHTPLPYATDTIPVVPKFLVCVFQVTASFVLVRSVPAFPTATHTPLPYATEQIAVVPKLLVCVVKKQPFENFLTIFLLGNVTLDPSSFNQPGPGDCTPNLISPSSKKLFMV
jgi:hypothetical protein